MPRFDLYKLPPEKQKSLLDRIFFAIASLSSFRDVKNFLKDLLSPQEMAMLARRIKIAEMLLIDKTYGEIRKVLGVGNDTIANVHKWVNSKRGGYKTVARQLRKFDARAQRHHERKMWRYETGWKKVKSIYPTLDYDAVQDLIDMMEDYAKKRKRKRLVKKAIK